MSQFFKVFRFEFGDYLRRKSFIWLTAALVAVLAVTMSWPRLAALFAGDGEAAPGQATRIAVATTGQGISAEGASAFFADYFAEEGGLYEFVPQQTDDPDTLEALVAGGEYAEAVLLDDTLGYLRYVPKTELMDSFGVQLSRAVGAYWKFVTLEAFDIPDDVMEFLLTGTLEATTIAIAGNEDAQASYWFTYALIMLLYMAVIMYGNFVAASVATEKSTRAMELLITSTSPKNLLFGKVLGAGCAGLLQLVIVLGSAVVFYGLNAAYYESDALVASIMQMPASLFFYIVLFFILGFFIYAFLFASMASLVSRMEDLSTAVTPVTWLFVAAFMIVIFSLVAPGGSDSPLMVFASFFPLTSPMAMFARVAAGGVPGWQVATSIGILVVSTLGIGLLASAIYHIGVLMYGTKPSLATVARLLRSQKKGAA